MTEAESENTLQFKMVGPGIDVQVPITLSLAIRVMSMIMDFPTETEISAQVSWPFDRTHFIREAAEFVASKCPRTNAQKIACLTYFICRKTHAEHVTNSELIDLNSAIPGIRAKCAQIERAVSYRYLKTPRRGFKALTARGLALVEALPYYRLPQRRRARRE